MPGAIEWTELAAGLSVTAAAMAALIYLYGKAKALARRIIHLGRVIDTGMEIIERELDSPEDGDTLKADVSGMAVALGQIQRRQDSADGRLERLTGLVFRLADLAANHHPEDAELRRISRQKGL